MRTNYLCKIVFQARFWGTLADMKAMFKKDNMSGDLIPSMASLLEDVAGESDTLASLDYWEQTRVGNFVTNAHSPSSQRIVSFSCLCMFAGRHSCG